MTSPVRRAGALAVVLAALALGGCVSNATPPTTTTTPVPTGESPTPSDMATADPAPPLAHCDDLLTTDALSSLGGVPVTEGPEELYSGATRAVGGLSCMWQGDGMLTVISVMPESVVPDQLRTEGESECIGGARCHLTRAAGSNVLFVEGWNGELNRAVADGVTDAATSLDLQPPTAAADDSLICESLAPEVEPVAGIGPLSVLGTDTVPHGPTWDTLVDAGVATYCVWGGTETTDSLIQAVDIWTYRGLAAPRDASGEPTELNGAEALLTERTSDGDAPRFEVIAWDGTNTVVTLGQGMTADAVKATAGRLLDLLER